MPVTEADYGGIGRYPMKTIQILPSKSDAHRAMICAALSELTSGKTCQVMCETSSQDIEATEACLAALQTGRPQMCCGESGSTLRFLLPVMAALGHRAEFYPEGRLPQRPLSPLYEELERHGCRLSPQGTVPFTIEGQLEPGIFRIPGDVSSQYISGLLFALPILESDSKIVVEGEFQSRPYVNMTVQTLEDFGISIKTIDDGFFIPGGQRYQAPPIYQVEGDWSNGCFWLAAGALTPGGVCVKGLNVKSLQGDKEILPLLSRFGAKTAVCEGDITVMPSSLYGIDINAAQIPDMVPILAVLACGAKGKTTIRNAGRLRIKESDRLASVSQVLSNLGASIKELPEGLEIQGTGSLAGGRADGWGDHRIVMMAAIASLICDEKVIITGSQAVKKSYPDFFQILEDVGLGNNIERN